MTLTEFIEHLKSQPWELDYAANLLDSGNNNGYYPVTNFINVFSWSHHFTRKPAAFWANLHADGSYSNSSPCISRTEFVRIIADIYSQTHPELFI